MFSTRRCIVWGFACLWALSLMVVTATPSLAGGGPGGDINPEQLVGPFIYGVATLEPESGPWPGAKTVASGVKATFVGTFVPNPGQKGAPVKFQAFFPTLPTFNFYQLTLYDLNFMIPGSKVLDLQTEKVQGLPLLGDGKIYVKVFDALSWDASLPRATVHTTLSYGPAP